ncbi:hypothetical protein PHYBLDRAFT_119834 [Phycomyces blakesleeanus NRRL 1555(-)]|uniref:Tc1-like transposase DDE domain-containing protein n=1 Tax=Phycomyces blakesleeanus (strain ATCC 8743b / DSM 1359 / FGSC 10004 / NBRC 33097 / NRRL 1555) TaxID=763407 RepID=A0A162W9P1_PHYB8|nr:hypothetical protein PHYBLDRAFT_119834 [Phycomyces blakesleeanus NRRL 1555(-)]OAD65675.1 hypothetical protein PHYBLDRAFT_119834 [Phycomyces blakesleeanus NRRL 1555(-)]|eukprot:XP_018283715.1 hypothetical protein PHYBLDRAFT_119834 [Phycomyces blakesleeanus NRRL 1555(-)]
MPRHIRAVLSKKCKENLGRDVLEWPAKSPDLNPNEYLWNLLGDCVRSRSSQPTTLKKLEEALQEEWKTVSLNVCEKYCLTLHKRVKAVIRNKGGHIPY